MGIWKCAVERDVNQVHDSGGMHQDKEHDIDDYHRR